MVKLKVEHWPVGKLKPYKNNPRKNVQAVGRMVQAIQEFGFRVPVLAMTGGEIVDGDLRLKAARKLGLKRIPVIPADDLSEAQIKAFRIMVNKSVEWAEWDDDLLAAELRDLAALDFDLELTGFNMEELERLLADVPDLQDGFTGDDDSPEVKESGTMAVIGEYRFPIKRKTYLSWMEKIKQTVGFGKRAVIAELKRRLQIEAA